MSHSLAVNSNLFLFFVLLLCTAAVFTVYFIAQKHRFSTFPGGVSSFFCFNLFSNIFVAASDKMESNLDRMSRVV